MGCSLAASPPRRRFGILDVRRVIPLFDVGLSERVFETRRPILPQLLLDERSQRLGVEVRDVFGHPFVRSLAAAFELFVMGVDTPP
jgi:hypothetical protein